MQEIANTDKGKERIAEIRTQQDHYAAKELEK